jgi:hypothetical protein
LGLLAGHTEHYLPQQYPPYTPKIDAYGAKPDRDRPPDYPQSTDWGSIAQFAIAIEWAGLVHAIDTEYPCPLASLTWIANPDEIA